MGHLETCLCCNARKGYIEFMFNLIGNAHVIDKAT
jgi:hypothetical protein